MPKTRSTQTRQSPHDLLATKLYIPSPRPNLVSRPRLLERLNQGLTCRLILISAPAGYGKTMLLSEWTSQVSTRDWRVAWLSLDEGDNDPARFLSYLVAALQTVDENIGRDPSRSLSEEAITALINRVSAIPHNIILVLDDCHLVTAQAVHDMLAFLLEHLPDNMRLVVATRADPPLPVARLRARGQLAELRQPDLRFTHVEAAELLKQAMGLPLVDRDIAALTARTEGWIAGLQMAALAIKSHAARGHADSSTFVAAFAGSNRYILDYFLEEVLYRVPERGQHFLLQTSILDRLCGPLCDAVVDWKAGTSDWESGEDRFSSPLHPPAFVPVSSQKILERLENSNMFIVPLDDHRQWYRYHQLFADLLRSRVQQTQPELVPVLHRRASDWYERHELMEEAIEHALAAQDIERATHLIEQNAEATLMRGELATFLRWVEALPDEVEAARPSLCAFHAWALMFSGRPWGAVEARLRKLEGAEAVSSKAAPLRAVAAILQGQVARAADLSHQALEQLPENERLLRGLAAWGLIASYFEEDSASAGMQALYEFAETEKKTGNVAMAALALCHLAEQHIAQGHLYKAQEIYQQSLESATDEQGRPLPMAGLAMIGLGELAREWNELEQAEHYLAHGLELSQQWGQAGSLDGYISLARVRQAQGDVSGAQAAIQHALEFTQKFDVTQADDWTAALVQALLWVAQGNLEPVERWVKERGVDRALETVKRQEGDASLDYHLHKYEQLVLVRLWLARHQPQQALALLDPLMAAMKQRGRDGRVIEIEALKALAFDAQGRRGQALNCMERAVTLAEPEGYVRVFADEGEPMRVLISDLRTRISEQGRHNPTEATRRLLAYVGHLLAAFGVTPVLPGQSKIDHPKPETVEPLSEREMEVLRLLPTSLSTAEMADELVISVNTLRTHLKSIYGKLGAHSRYDATARAKDLGLL